MAEEAAYVEAVLELVGDLVVLDADRQRIFADIERAAQNDTVTRTTRSSCCLTR